MATTLHAITGIPFIISCLKRIDLTKDLYTIELEQGLEVLVPRSLSQEHLPYSFRYYDALIAMVRERVSAKTCQTFMDRCQLSF